MMPPPPEPPPQEPPAVCSANSEESSEPNDSTASAHEISPGEWAGGLCNETPDYYRITSSGSWEFKLIFDPSMRDITLTEVDESGFVLQEVEGADSFKSLLGSGPSLVKVAAPSDLQALYRVLFSESAGAVQEDVGDFYLVWDNGDRRNTRAQIEESMNELVNNFLNLAFKLPQNIAINFQECGFVNAFYSPDSQEITMCYEMYQEIESAFRSMDPRASNDEVFEATILTWIYILLHEVGHAFVDIYELPITGREEDTADDFSALMVYWGGAPNAIIYASYFWSFNGGNISDDALADEHSLSEQRMYNLLCFLYGADPQNFSYVLEYFPSLETRSVRCPGEFQQKLSSWRFLLESWLMLEL